MRNLYLFPVLVLFLNACNSNNQIDNVEARLPNIIVILADDMGFGDVQAYNPESKIATPNINSLAEEGMKFMDAHTNSAVCTPTRYGLVTGRYAWRTRMKRGVLSGYSSHLIDTGRTTIASLVKQKGYSTAVIGKWHLGVDYPWITSAAPEGFNRLNYFSEDMGIDYSKAVKNGPNSLGFDYSFIIPGSLDMSPYVYLENGKATAIPDSISPMVPFPAFSRKGEISPDFSHQTALDKLTQKAIEYIKDRSKEDDPFLLYFPLTGPHKPALVAERFEGKSGFGPYGDLVMQVDWTVGEVMKAIKENGIDDNTIVIYTSDNGSYMFRIDAGKPDHVDDETVQGFHVDRRQSNYIWRGTKADIYDGGHRIPFIVRWPGNIQEGTSNLNTICMTDIFSTIAEISGIAVSKDAGADSYSFLSLLQGQKSHERPPVIHHSINGTFSVRYGKWKMIFAEGSGGRQKPVGKPFQEPYQLYNIEKDPSETQNVIEDHADVAALLANYLEQIRSNGSSKEFSFNTKSEN